MNEKVLIVQKKLNVLNTLKQVGYSWLKKQVRGINDDRQVLIFDKLYKKWGLLSVYGVSINLIIQTDPSRFYLYQLW